MEIGVSLACFYPEPPECVIHLATSLGFRVAELFINTFCELDQTYLTSFRKKCDQAGLSIYSLHPFTSALENYMFFSRYDRRIKDSVCLYHKYCDAADILGARVINIHGDRGLALTDFEEYVACLAPLAEISEKRSVLLSHENVFYNSVNHPEIVRRLIDTFGDAIRFTFDIKQAHKGGSDPYRLCETMGSNISNFHINDYDDGHLCMLPGQGKVDYRRIFSALRRQQYAGPALIEVYRQNYQNPDELERAAAYLRQLQNECL